MNNQCPFAVYDYLCDSPDCDDCSIRIEAQAKEDHEIAENTKDYWRHINSGAAK